MKLFIIRIVLIEDNEAFAQGVVYQLQDRGHAVDWLSDGAAGDAHLR